MKTKKIICLILCAAVLLSAVLIQSGSTKTKNSGTIIIPFDETNIDWMRANDTEIIKLVNTMLEDDVPVQWALKDFQVDGKTYPAGTMYICLPFESEQWADGDQFYEWVQWHAKSHKIYNISKTSSVVNVESKELVLPRILLFYDDTTYDNTLMHYKTMRNLGFKVTIATAAEIEACPWDDPNSVFADCNVFAMPGGSLHFYSFMDMEMALNNITGFVNNGGGYIGVCAGSSEALSKSAYPYTCLLDAAYHDEWFAMDDPTHGDWEWRQLIGPIYLEVQDTDCPVTFGYGSDAVRPGYGPMTTMYYYGGPAMFDLDPNVTALATYNSPVTQKTEELVSNIWGSVAIATQSYGDGEVVLYGPHPEWPGPCKRMYAQALYYCAKEEKNASMAPAEDAAVPQCLDAARVDAIVSSAADMKPLLEDITRNASKMVNMRSGDHYHPLGGWYDEVIQTFGTEVYDQINELSRNAEKFEFEFARLTALKAKTDDPAVIAKIDEALVLIDHFFTYSENLIPGTKPIYETDWTECGPYETLGEEYDVHQFSDIIKVLDYIQREVEEKQVPMVEAYTEIFNTYEDSRIAYEISGSDEDKAITDELYMTVGSSWPAGDFYKTMYGLMHTCAVFEYRIENHLMNLISIADLAEEAIEVANFLAADDVGSVAYAAETVGAFAKYPMGGIVK